MSGTSQMDLLTLDADHDGLLLPDERVRHVFTGEQMERRSQLKEAVVMLLGAGFGVEIIASRLSLSPQTVRELRNREWSAVVGSKNQFGEVLIRTGMRWVGIARSKEEHASFKDLTIGAGILFQRGAEALSAAMGVVGEGRETNAAADPEATARRLAELMTRPAKVIEVAPDSESGATAAQVPDGQQLAEPEPVRDAVRDAGGTAVAGDIEAGRVAASKGAGGGSAAAGGAEGVMYGRSGGLQPKAAAEAPAAICGVDGGDPVRMVVTAEKARHAENGAQDGAEKEAR